MSKIILIQFLVAVLLCPCVATAIDIIEVSVGNENSGSWEFTEQFSELWLKKYPDEGTEFRPRHVANVRERFENLRKGSSAFVVAPLKSLSHYQMREMKVKVVLVLWKTFLVAVGVGDPPPPKLADCQEWFVLENSVIIPTVFRNSPKLYTQPEIIETKSDELDKIYEHTGALFFETIGPIDDLNKVLGKKLDILKMDRRLVAILLKRHSWLESFQLSAPRMKTVALTMALFARQSQDQKLMEQTLSALFYPPRSIFPRPHIIKNLSLEDTFKIPRHLLHPESLKYLKRRSR